MGRKVELILVIKSVKAIHISYLCTSCVPNRYAFYMLLYTVPNLTNPFTSSPSVLSHVCSHATS